MTVSSTKQNIKTCTNKGLGLTDSQKWQIYVQYLTDTNVPKFPIKLLALWTKSCII